MLADGIYGEYIKEDGAWRNGKFRHAPKLALLQGNHEALELTERQILEMSDSHAVSVVMGLVAQKIANK